jgi:dolichyl-diphosphooligosaccharide--protein glycosyltransferase
MNLILYFDWHDNMSWYPEGRNISATSQVMLHVTAAFTYQIFGGDLSLYDFTILFPVIFGSLTVIGIFALVRVIGGTTAGLFAAILFSVSLPILLRGTIGWFKSEPLGIFFGILGLYFFLSGIKSESKKIAISKLIVGGIVLAFGLASWGGIQFFVIPIGMLILILPFVRKDHEFIIWSIPTFVSAFLLTSLMFEFVGTRFVFGLGGFSLIVPTGFLVSCIIIQKISKIENKTRNGLIFLFMLIIIGSFLIIINEEAQFLPLPSFRYLNAINPFLTTTVPLVDSVAEHATTTLAQSFFFHSILMIFAALGIWIILSKKFETISYVKNDMIAFSLIIGLSGVYISSAFVRLEVFASISLIILSSLGLSILIKEIFGNKNIFKKFRTEKIIKISFLSVIVILLIIPLVFPNSNWINAAKAPPTILNGGSAYGVSTDDWTESLEWIKNNTPEDSVVAAWWDYGYWITTMSDRTTLADNFTGNHTRIELIAKTLLSPPDEAWNNLQRMGADYVVVFVAGQRIDEGNNQPVYLLNGGGDESKKQWFMRIAREPLQKYVHPDGSSGTDEFWNNTLLGKLFP